jgi:hypothetical protein
MINTIETNAKNQYVFIQTEVLQWSITIDDLSQALRLSKNLLGSRDTSKFRTYASDDMLELIQFCMGSVYYVKAEIIEQVIDSTIADSQAVSDGVMSGFADYLSALSIVVDADKIAELKAYCLANGYQWDERLDV